MKLTIIIMVLLVCCSEHCVEAGTDQKGSHLYLCFRNMSRICERRYTSYKIIPSTYNFTTTVSGNKLNVYCREDESGIACFANDKEWMRCYCFDKNDVRTRFKKENIDEKDLNGVCEALDVYKAFLKINWAQPLFDHLDWSEEPEMYECLKALVYSCKTRYIKGIEYKEVNWPIKVKTNLRGAIVEASCHEAQRGMMCAFGGYEWFKCYRASSDDGVVLEYDQGTYHDIVSDYYGVCEALSAFRKLIRSNVARDYANNPKEMDDYSLIYYAPEIDKGIVDLLD